MTLSPITLKKFFFLLRDSFPFNDKVSQDCHTPEPTIKLQTEAQELGFLMDVAVTSFPSAQRGYLYLPPPPILCSLWSLRHPFSCPSSSPAQYLQALFTLTRPGYCPVVDRPTFLVKICYLQLMPL